MATGNNGMVSNYHWLPSADTIAQANLTQLIKSFDVADYQALHQLSVKHPESFWTQMFNTLNIKFNKPYATFCDLKNGPTQPQWLVGAKLNITDSCWQGDLKRPAIIYQKPNQALKTVSLDELKKLSSQVANGLQALDFKAGDAIAIAMPMTMEAVAIYLGIIMFGGVVVSIADSFAPDEIETRLRISHAKAIFTQDVILRGDKALPMYEKVISADAPMAIVLSAAPKSNSAHQPVYAEASPGKIVNLRADDLAWLDFLSDNAEFNAYPCHPETPCNLLFSSGTTGDPKAIPWTQLTPIKAASDAYCHHDIHAGDILCWPTNLGWMMGPWLIYAALINQASIALYDDAPLTREFGAFVQDAKVTMLGLVPSLVKAWRQSQCMENLDWSAIKCFSSTGECSNTDDMTYLMQLADNKPIIEYCGGTEIGGAYITGTVLQTQRPAYFSTPAMGLDFFLLDENNQASANGEVALIAPSFGLSTSLLNRNHFETYFKDMPKGPNAECLRRHGDHIEQLEDECYRAHGRLDDTMNLGGIKTSSADIERVLINLDHVTEVAAIAVAPAGGGPSQLVIYAVLDDTQALAQADLLKLMQTNIREYLNPLFKIHELKIIDKLPRTASNKIMRRTLRDMFHA